MKIISIIVALLATASSASASCGYTFVDQSFPSVPLSEFGMNSVFTAKHRETVVYQYDFSHCIEKTTYGGAYYPEQKFPSVPLSEFGIDSWKIAK